MVVNQRIRRLDATSLCRGNRGLSTKAVAPLRFGVPFLPLSFQDARPSPLMTAIASRLPGVQDTVGRLAVRFDLFRGALALLIFLNVSRIHQHFRWMAPFRPALVLAGLAVLYALLNPRALSTRGLLDTRPARLILAMAVFACVSAPFGISLGASGYFILESYSKVIIGALLLIAAIRQGRDLYTFIWAYVLGCGVLAYFSIFVFGLSSAGSAAERLSDLYMYDANDTGLIMLIALPLALLLIQVSRGVGKVAAGVVLIGIGVTLARTGSRGAFVGLLATGLALLLLLQTIPLWKRAAAVVVTGTTLYLAAPPGYWVQMETILSPKEDYNWTATDGRKQVTERGISYMMAFPVFGLGINNFYRAECIEPLSDKVRFHQQGTGIRCSAPHNSYIQAGAELGIPGLILWCMLVLGGIISMLRLRPRLPAAWRHGDSEQRFLYLTPLYIAVAMSGFAVSSFFVSFAWLDIVYILTAFMAGLQVSVEGRLRTGPSVAPATAPLKGRRQATQYRRSVILPG